MIIYVKKPISFEQLIIKSGIELSELQNILFDLQLEGLIEQDMQGYWKLV